MKPIRVLLADDHPLLRAGIRSLLEEMEGVEVVAEAADGREALSLIKAHRPEFLLTDIAMPGVGGLDLTEQVGRDHPQIKVIILSMHKDEEYVRRAVLAGAAGYLLKDSDTEELGLALRAVARGETYLSPAVSTRLLADYRKQVSATSGPAAGNLTPRQREILQLIAEGMTTKAIASRLGISSKTVEWHRSLLMERLGIHDVVSLVRYAMRMGLIAPEE
jgi:DNA-binding NarL/FixJ family response regulator